MAKASKKPIKPKKKSGSKKKKSGNIFTKLIVIVFVLILALFMIFSVFKPSNKPAKVEKAKVEQKVKVEEKKVEKKAEQKEDKKVEAKVEQKTDKKAEQQEKKKQEAEVAKTDKKEAETKVVSQSIKGTWQSSTGGAFLTMDGKEYRLDFMGVEMDQPIIGTYTVDGDLITFINKKDPCKDVKGLYEVKFNKQEIGFKCKSDDCTKRKATLPTEWTWLDTEE